eukprot:4504540-Pleurochrysis_carterae.AAC.1
MVQEYCAALRALGFRFEPCAHVAVTADKQALVVPVSHPCEIRFVASSVHTSGCAQLCRARFCLAVCKVSRIAVCEQSEALWIHARATFRTRTDRLSSLVNIIWKTGRAVSQPRAALASRSTAGKHASKFIVWTERCAPRTCLEEVKALEYVFGARSADSGKLPQDAPP